MEIQWNEHDIEEVFNFFVTGFANSDQIRQWDATYDPRTGNVIFKLYVEKAHPVKDEPVSRGETPIES